MDFARLRLAARFACSGRADEVARLAQSQPGELPPDLPAGGGSGHRDDQRNPELSAERGGRDHWSALDRLADPARVQLDDQARPLAVLAQRARQPPSGPAVSPEPVV